MEGLRYSEPDVSEGLMDKWNCWQEFKKMWRYVEVMTSRE